MTLPKSVKVRSTCNACQQAKIRCSHEKPSCRRCQKHNIDCVYSMSRRLGRPAKKRDPDVRKRKPKKEPVEDASQDVDFSTDSWLQDFITDLPVPESGQGLLDTVVTENNPLESIPTCASTSVNLTDTDQRMPYYDPAFVQSSRDTLDMALLPMDMDTSASPADTLPSISTPISPPIDPSPSNVPFQQPPLPNPQPSTARAPAPRRPYEYEYPFPDAAGTNFDPYTPASCQCQCHEQTLHELVRVNMTLCAAARTAPAGTIDAILTCQRGLQNLAEAILSCSVCAGTRVTLLTVVMVGIDSFISAMEVITTTSDELFPKYPSPQGIGCSSGGSGNGNDSGSGGTAFKSQIEACPLLVRDFRMPPEERYIFVKQVLQTRLGGLLTTIRRIRFCTQEMLAGSVAKGRLIMMMETDRRLQMVMMRIRMINR